MRPYQNLCRLAQEASSTPTTGLSCGRSLTPRLLLTDIDHANVHAGQVSFGDHEIPEFEVFAAARDPHDHALKHGRVTEAATCAVAMFDLATTQLERGIAYNAAAGVHKAMGNHLDARNNYNAALDLLSAHPSWVSAVQNNLASIAIRLGELDRARALTAQVLANPSARSYRRGWAHMNLGEVALRSNCLQDASDLFEQASELFREAQSNRFARAPTTDGASPEQMFALAYLSHTRGRLGKSEGIADLCQIAHETLDDDPETALTALIFLAHLRRDPQLLERVADAAANDYLFEIHHLCHDLLVDLP
jgi:tetratricopeptide (TPR) repeat protein